MPSPTGPSSSRSGSQARTFLALLRELQPYFRTDRNVPTRIQQRITQERRFGSRDRRLYRELLYTAMRYLPWIEEKARISDDEIVRAVVWLAAPSPAIDPLKSTFASDLGPTPAAIVEKAQALNVQSSLVPDWTAEQCPSAATSPNLDALHTRAPLWLRLQTDRPDAVFNEFQARGWAWNSSPDLADAIELLTDADVTTTEAFARGQIEVQDLGSQFVLASVQPPAGGKWLDACAGAGGKTLQLARLLGAAGAVVAHDIRSAALSELRQRATRAGLRNVSVSATPEGVFDGVLVDAPCTGTGTWRRSPHLKWQTTRDDIAKAAATQLALLKKFSAHVRPGGLLVYATCSLCRDENQTVVEEFFGAHSDFSPAPFTREFKGERSPVGLTFWPATKNTDGFFVSALRRVSSDA